VEIQDKNKNFLFPHRLYGKIKMFRVWQMKDICTGTVNRNISYLAGHGTDTMFGRKRGGIP
jgi:hypothetical protein